MANNLNTIKEINAEIDNTTKKLNVVLQDVLKISQATLEIQKNFSKISTPSEANKKIKETASSTEKLNNLARERDKLNTSLQRSESKLTLATSLANKQLVQNKVELQRSNSSLREAAKLSSSLSSEYEKQQIKLNQLIKVQRNLELRRQLGKKLTVAQRKELTRLTKEIQRQQKAFLKVDAAAGRFQRNVGNYPAALNSAASAARGLASALGLVGGAFLFVRVVRDALKTIRDFEKQNATLSAVLQQTSQQTKELTDNALELGATTVKTATDVTSLQIAYARLGFTQEQILDLTEATIEGSIALNSELEGTAILVGGVVNSFTSLNASDAPRILDVLSLSTAKSALNFEKLNTALPIVGGAANAVGVTFEELVSQLGKLADANIDVSTGATSLRNIFIESAKTGVDFRDTLKEVRDSQDQLTTANDAFGKRAAVSAVVLANNIDKVVELNEALNNAKGTAKEFADKELDTLDGSLKLLKSAWEGVILSTNEGNSVSNSLKDTIKSLSENLGFLISAIFLGIKAFTAYKIALLLAALQQKLLNIQMFNSRKASLAATFGISKLTLAWVNFTKVLRKNALGIAVTALVLLYEALNTTSKSTSDLVDEMNDLNKGFSEEQKQILRTNNELTKLSDTYTELTDKTERSEEENTKLKETIEDISKEVPRAITSIGEYGQALDISTDSVTKFVEENNKLVGLRAEEALENQRKSLDELNRKLSEAEGAQKGVNINFVKGVGYYKSINGELIKLTASSDRFGAITEQVGKLTRDENIALLEYVTSLKSSKKELEDQIEVNKELLLNSKGLRSERQKEADQLAKKIKQDKKEIDRISSQILLIPKLRKEIRLLRKERLELTKDGVTITEEDSVNKIDKEIKALESRISAILGNSKAQKKNIKALKGSISFAENQIKVLENQRSMLSRNSKEWNDYTKLIDAANLSLSKLRFQLEGIDLESVGDKLRSSYQVVKDSLEEIKESTGLDDLFKDITDLNKKELDNQIDDFEKAEDRKREILKNSLRLQNDLRQEFTYSAIEAINNIFDTQIQKYEEEIQANSDYYDALLDNEELTESQREALQLQKQERENQLREKQKEQERKAFLFNQALALAEIAINLAKTISAINLAAALIDSITFGVGGIPYRAANIPFAIGIAAAQTASVLSRSIPAFAEGGTMDHDGLMKINDHYSGRQELVKRDGELFTTDKKNAIVYGKKGDEIIPDAKEYLSSFSDNHVINNLQKHIVMANVSHQNYLSSRYDLNDRLINSNDASTRKIVKAINSQSRPVHLSQKIDIGKDLRFLNYKRDTL